MSKTIWITLIAGIAAGALGCEDDGSYDLPAGWEGARHVAIFLGPEGESCAEDAPLEEGLSAGLRDGRVRLVYEHGTYSCAEDHEAFVRERAGGFDVLLQPVEMHPDALAGCMCNYRARLEVGAGAAGAEVSLYRRNNYEVEADPQPALIGSAAVEEAADCAGLTACDVDNGCDFEGEIDGQELGCVQLPSCGGAYCVFTAEACVMECGRPSCLLMESYPAQVGCQ